MKAKAFSFLCLAFISISALKGQNNEPSMDSLSYSLGILLAQNLKQQGFDNVNLDDLARGVADQINGNPLQIEMKEANRIVQEYAEAQQAKKYEGIIKEGEAFLAANAQKEGVSTTASGLQYRVITPGTGAQPTASSSVTVHYSGKLLDGTEFDSSYKRNEPTTFGVGQVISGWTEALQLMKEGSKWEIFIPYNLAYGERGAGQAIPPYATLIFEVELISVK